jgi:hypothetical protein
MHDFLLEARDEGLIRFITDNGGGGLSSSIGESALFSNGCDIQLEKVPLKYDGLDQWEIWISESQERMTVAIDPAHLDRFMALSRQHAVESTRDRHLHRYRANSISPTTGPPVPMSTWICSHRPFPSGSSRPSGDRRPCAA